MDNSAQEVRIELKPAWIAWWFHKLLTYPKITCGGVAHDGEWGKGHIRVLRGQELTVGFSYKVFHDSRVRCQSQPVRLVNIPRKIVGKTSLLNQGLMSVELID
ncbi:hypothetical protein [Corynebacterium lowii]|uniref:Uncharacterized protein n=1 Tax=Corynebacterium lowii TaxID=1544413 RepID=A0A0Q0YIZ2_9CORY|nr:hypothetical protein [Corynebacterium lowii]KQB86736.1 hypothetical protein Clow_00944 [Corynebacterium lowii]MDP9851422.1 hypothetical protein [Corynebacterium lowii]